MRKYMSIFDPSHEKLIEFINRYYARSGWRIISIVKGNGAFWATLEKDINNEKWYSIKNRKYLWKEMFWSKSFCLLTTGGAPIEVIKKYIEEQGQKSK